MEIFIFQVGTPPAIIIIIGLLFPAAIKMRISGNCLVSLYMRTRTMWLVTYKIFHSPEFIYSHTATAVATKNLQSAIHSHAPPLHCLFAAGDETAISTSKNDFMCELWSVEWSEQKARRQIIIFNYYFFVLRSSSEVQSPSSLRRNISVLYEATLMAFVNEEQ